MITFSVKYIPQFIMNYRYKSTKGWSIGYVLMNFFGSLFSLMQMILFSINYNDWLSIVSSITTFGLAIVSIGFDLIFLVQHYILYKNNRQQLTEYQILDNNEDTITPLVNA